MTSKLFQLFVTQFLIIKVMSSYMQPYSLSPYVTRESAQIPQKPYVTEREYHNYPSNYAHPTYKKSEPVLVQVQPSRAPPDVTNIKTIPTPNNLEIPNKCSGNLDSHVLNNLAIALQLLIVNNIINNPPPEPNHLVSPLAETILGMTLPVNSKLSVHDHEAPFQMPNAQFLGSSNFGNDVMSKGMVGLPSFGSHSASPFSRSGINLMSPYDAIASSVPLSEAITSSYLSKKDFQSPYAAILAADLNRDLFSMDFF
ncbi:uncharacterized protein LOC126778980 [Nymphalis io]|uniref:uncharacterized protein LOC126778980 n=1 Tax=Inachis io TaxID=171585 RepID=UPI002168FE11|nr:uncharacterized protein LOC126778980 [Nymphalis io]